MSEDAWLLNEDDSMKKKLWSNILLVVIYIVPNSQDSNRSVK